MKYLLCNVCIVLRKMMRTMPIGDRAVTTMISARIRTWHRGSEACRLENQVMRERCATSYVLLRWLLLKVTSRRGSQGPRVQSITSSTESRRTTRTKCSRCTIAPAVRLSFTGG